MATFFAIPTLAGQAKLAAAMDGGDPIVLSEMAVGDGGGNAVIPLETQTGLVRETARVPLTAIDHVDNRLTADALLDETIGGFVIREAGLIDEVVINLVPHLLGAGIPLLATGMERSLTLSDQRRFNSGTLQVHYRVQKQANVRTQIPAPRINVA